MTAVGCKPYIDYTHQVQISQDSDNTPKKLPEKNTGMQPKLRYFMSFKSESTKQQIFCFEECIIAL